MKNTSKILALVLVLMTVLMSLSALTVSAAAGETWTVAGSQALCGTNWDVSNKNNDMTYDDATDSYVKVFTNVKAGSYEIKCAKNHAWGTSYGNGSSNYSFKVAKDGSTVTVTLKGTKVTVTVEVPTCNHVYVEAGGTATCLSAGTVIWKCSVCQDSYTENFPNPRGHYYDENGQCVRCDDKVELVRVYVENKANWAEVYCYTWDTNPYIAWPGEKMKLDEESGLYYYDIPKHFVNVIFNNGSGTQSSNLKTPTNPCQALYNNSTKQFVENHNNTVVTTPATCTEAGSTVTTCNNCGKTTTAEIPALGHSYGDNGACTVCGHVDACPHTETVVVSGKDATCEEPGLTDGAKCAACDEITTPQTTIPATGHDWAAATFEAPKTCKNCGSTEGKALVPLYFKPGAKWNDANPWFAAYFFGGSADDVWVKFEKVSDGLYVCAIPEGYTGMVFARFNPEYKGDPHWKNGDNDSEFWGQSGDQKVPTDGNNMFVLNDKEWDSGYWHPVEGHAWTKGEVTKPTCTTEGYTTYKCACGATEKRDTVPATGHDADYILKGQCGACGTYNIIVVGDNTISVNATFPLDQAGGFYQFSYISIAEAGHYVFDGGLTTFVSVIFAESAPIQAFTASAWLEPGVYMIGLNFYAGAGDYALNVSKVECTNDSVVTAPTCTEAGYTTHTCTLCGHKVVDSEVAALGHDIVVDEAVAPTCTETGLTAGQHCSRCDGATVAQEEVPSLGHDWSEGNECSRCQAPKCAHEWSETVVAPTCVKDGYTLHACSKCGENYKDTTVPATGSHTWVETVVAPTCTEAGSKTNTCSVCEETKTEEIPALGHTFANGYCVCGAAEFVPGVHVLNVDATLAGGYRNTVVRISEAGMYHIHSNSIAIIWIYTTELSTSNPEDWPSDPAQGNWLIRSETGYAYLEPGDYIFGIYCLGFVPVGEYTLTIEAHTEHTFVEGKCACGEEDPTYVPEDPGQQPGGDEPSEPSDPSDDPSDEPTTPAPQLSVWDKIVAFLKKILAMILGFFKK